MTKVDLELKKVGRTPVKDEDIFHLIANTPTAANWLKREWWGDAPLRKGSDGRLCAAMLAYDAKEFLAAAARAGLKF